MALIRPANRALIRSVHISGIVDLLSGVAGSHTQPVVLSQLSDAVNPTLYLRNQNAGGSSLKIRDYADAVDVLKVYRSATLGTNGTAKGNIFQLADNVRFGLGNGVDDNGLMYVNTANAESAYSMARFYYDNTGNIAATDVGAGIFLMRQLTGGADNYTRALEVHNLKASGTTNYPQLAMEMSIESSVAGNTIDRLVGLDIANRATNWGIVGGVRADSAIRIGNDEFGFYQGILYQDTAGAGGGTLFKVDQTGRVYTGDVWPTANITKDIGAGSLQYRVVYGAIFAAGNGTIGQPSFGFSGDPDNGLILAATNAVGFVSAGAEQIRLTSTGFWDFRNSQIVALGGGAAPTVGTIGGSGPTAAAQSGWLKILLSGAARFIPTWT